MRILVVEDDSILADGLVRSLQQAGYAVDWAETGTKANAALAQENYYLVILDIGLPGMDGFEVLRRLRQRKKYIPVLILTARDSVEDRVRGLDLGADDYLVKPFALPELKARVRAILRRGQSTTKSEIAYGPLVLDTNARRVRLYGKPLDLTLREWGLLEFLLLNTGKVLAKEEIIEALCDWGEELSPNAVEVYVSRLRNKIEYSGIKIRTMRGFGYLLEEPENEKQ
ncbi:MAG TPA: response regulator transcription factor [Burkholderiales bacterium]|nr:response regulator transcription factor [Burkholderiales bacterium]